MCKLEELETLIEQLRIKMYKVAEDKVYTNPEVIKASQELDAVLVKYQHLCRQQKQ
ncbi:MAG: Spo0E family sporulation regulatory protein-aspartic acid phosphatase [Sporomusa sp.]